MQLSERGRAAVDEKAADGRDKSINSHALPRCSAHSADAAIVVTLLAVLSGAVGGVLRRCASLHLGEARGEARVEVVRGSGAPKGMVSTVRDRAREGGVRERGRQDRAREGGIRERWAVALAQEEWAGCTSCSQECAVVASQRRYCSTSAPSAAVLGVVAGTHAPPAAPIWCTEGHGFDLHPLVEALFLRISSRNRP